MSRIPEDDLVLMEFFTTWCVYSRLLKPKLLWLAERYAGRVMCTRVDADSDRELTDLLDVEYVPALVLLRRGQVEHRWYGDTPLHFVTNKLAAYVA